MFSIIIPLYNKSPFIQRAINSVLNQSFKDYEVIVVNDGSTDGGGESVAKLYGNQVNLINQRNQGVSVARNKGIEKAKFPYIAFLDADDYWHCDFLHWIKFVLDNYPKVGLVGSTYSNSTLSEKVSNPQIKVIDDYFNQAIENTLFTSSSTVIDKSFFDKNEGFKNHLTKGEDIDVWLRAFAWFGRAYYIQAPLMYYDLKASASIGSNPGLHETVFYDIYRDDYAISNSNSTWLIFRDKYLMLNLFQNLYIKENYHIGKRLLDLRNDSYFLCQLPYSLPHPWIRFILRKPKLKKLVRNYLKFCFKYIYT